MAEPALDLETDEITALEHLGDNFVIPDKIDSDHGLQGASDLINDLKAALNRVDTRRREYKQPHLDAGRAVDARFKKISEPLQEKHEKLKKIAAAYMAERDRQRRAEAAAAEEKARKERERLERRAAAAAEKGQEEKALDLQEAADETVAAVPEAAPKAKGLATVTTYEYTIGDADLITRKFLIPDEQKIGALVRNLGKDAESIVGGIVVTERTSVRSTGR